MKYIRLATFFLTLFLLVISMVIGRETYSYFQPVTSGDKFILLRFEDVGPGGFYGTAEGLGKLRAVLEYMQQQQVPYHVTVVSRWKHYDEKTGWYNVGIDTPTPLTESFVKLLQNAQNHGAVLGMHGYSHQWGDSPRADEQENSGYAFEFNVKGEPYSKTREYAAERIEKSLQAFKQNGLFPAFWESPHYHATREQEQVFRSYMGIIYEPDWDNLRSLKDVIYYDSQNTWKQNSQGAVYIPAPLRYIFNEERVQEVLSKLQNYHGLASMYYHPYLEFSYLEPVTDNEQPITKDGLPVFQYKSGQVSPLHKLLDGIKQTRYTFGSIYDVVPFTPAHRIQLLPLIDRQHLKAADMNGDGRDDWVALDTLYGKLTITLSNLEWPRNSKTLEPTVWLQNSSLLGKNDFLFVQNEKNKRSDLLLTTGQKLLLYQNEGNHFQSIPTELKFRVDDSLSHVTDLNWLSNKSAIVAVDTHHHMGILFTVVAAKAGKDHGTSLIQKAKFQFPIVSFPNLSQFFLADVNADSINDFVMYDPASQHTWVMKGTEDGFAEPVVWLSKSYGEQVSVADTNGDGRSDMVFYNRTIGIWQVARSTGLDFEKIPASFGPWAITQDGVLLTGDWDGNAKADVAVYSPESGTVDTAFSYQR